MTYARQLAIVILTFALEAVFDLLYAIGFYRD